MSDNPYALRLRGHDDMLIAFEKRIESLETTRAFHADTLKRLTDRIDKLSDAFRARADELAGLLESAINLGQHQASQQTDGNLRLGVSMDTLQESLIRLQHDTANRIAGLSIDVRQLSNAVAEQDKKIVRLDNDDESIHAEMQSRTEQLSDRVNQSLEKIQPAPEFIRYTHADDLRAVIRDCFAQAFATPEQSNIIGAAVAQTSTGTRSDPFAITRDADGKPIHFDPHGHGFKPG